MLVKRIDKIIRENAFDQKKKKPELKFNLGLALIGLRITGPCTFTNMNHTIHFLMTFTDFMAITSRLNADVLCQ